MVGMITYSLLLSFLAKETLPIQHNSSSEKPAHEPFGGYLTILRDTPFISFIVAFTLVMFCAVMMWVLLGVYAKQNFGIPENLYGWIATTNAVMVILFQLPMTGFRSDIPILGDQSSEQLSTPWLLPVLLLVKVFGGSGAVWWS